LTLGYMLQVVPIPCSHRMYICTRACAFCLFVLSNLSNTCVCITRIFRHLHACVGKNDLEAGFFSACPCFLLVAGVGGYALAGVEIEVMSCKFPYFCGWWGGVWVCADDVKLALLVRAQDCLSRGRRFDAGKNSKNREIKCTF